MLRTGFRLFLPIFNSSNLLVIPPVLVISVSSLVFTRIIHFTSKVLFAEYNLLHLSNVVNERQYLIGKKKSAKND